MTPAEERAFSEGQRAIWTGLLTSCIKELRGLGTTVADPTLRLAQVERELEQTRAMLAQLCADYGHDVPPNLFLPDVVDKYLRPYLVEPQ